MTDRDEDLPLPSVAALVVCAALIVAAALAMWWGCDG